MDSATINLYLLLSRMMFPSSRRRSEKIDKELNLADWTRRARGPKTHVWQDVAHRDERLSGYHLEAIQGILLKTSEVGKARVLQR